MAAKVWKKKKGASLPSAAQRAWMLAYCRKPSAAETRVIAEFVDSQLEFLRRHPKRLPKGVSAETQVITNLCQVLMSSNEFLYVD